MNNMQRRGLCLVCTGALLTTLATASGLVPSFSGIENLKAAHQDDAFVILEVIPQEGSSTMGYYVSGYEPGMLSPTQEGYDAYVQDLKQAGLLGGNAPLAEVVTPPWEAQPAGTVLSVVEESYSELAGYFYTKTGGGYQAYSPDGYSGTSYLYVGAGQGNVGMFLTGTISSGGATRVYYRQGYVSLGNRDWFSLGVLDDDAAATKVEVRTIVPSAYSSLDTFTQELNQGDLLVLSPGFSLEENTNLAQAYHEDNDLTAQQVDAIMERVFPVDGESAPLPLVFDTRLGDVDAPTLAGMVQSLETLATSQAFVAGSVYAYAPDSTRQNLISGGFLTPFDAETYDHPAVGYYPVYQAIVEENLLRGGVALLDETNISMATAIRQVLNQSWELSSQPEVSITSAGGTQIRHLFLPTVFGSAGDQVLEKAGGQVLDLRLNDGNVVRTALNFYLYHQHDLGVYYYDEASESMMLYAAGVTPVEAQRYDRTVLPSSLYAGHDGKVLVEAAQTIVLPSAVVQTLSQGENDALVRIYVEVQTTVGAKVYRALSNAVDVRKLGLLML